MQKMIARVEESLSSNLVPSLKYGNISKERGTSLSSLLGAGLQAEREEYC